MRGLHRLIVDRQLVAGSGGAARRPPLGQERTARGGGAGAR